MTQNQQAQTVAYTKMIILAAQELLKIAESLKYERTDITIVIADSVKEIATANSRIIDHIHGITNSLDVEVFKNGDTISIDLTDAAIYPTISAYGDTRYSVKEVNDYIPQ